MTKKVIIFFAALTIFSQKAAAQTAGQYHRYAVGIHFDTEISGGHYAPEKLVQMALDNGLDAVIFCDHDRMEVEYGLQPLRNIAKKIQVEPSLHTYGFQNYLDLVEELTKKYPQITLIDGCETGPYYYWSGSFLSKNLVLHNWHQHMMVIGLPDSAAYNNIPATSSKIYSERSPDFLYSVIAAAAVILGIAFTQITIKRTVTFAGHTMRVKRKPYRIPGVIIAILCLVYIYNNYPFRRWLFSPYETGHKIPASQAVIDYAQNNDALIYYSHPEGEFFGEYSGLKVQTESYTHLLLSTNNYTGFAVFAEGWKKAGLPSGEWDQTLYQYCTGERAKPVWAIGELDFEGDLPPEFLREVSTFVWAKDRSRASILEALRLGRCYAAQIWGPNFLFLEEWNISDSNAVKISGETLETAGEINLRLSFSVYDEKTGFEAMIIRNGRQLATVAFDESTVIDFPDFPPQGHSFYRLWVLYRGIPILASNPIFVKQSYRETDEPVDSSQVVKP